MPCIPLVITSALFIIPSVIGIFKKKKVDVVATSLLTCTSLWFHSSNSMISYVIDKTYAHMFGVLYYTKSLVRCHKYRRPCDFVIVGFGTGSILCYVKEGNVLNIMLHALVHISSVAAFSLYIVTNDDRTHQLLPSIK